VSAAIPSFRDLSGVLGLLVLRRREGLDRIIDTDGVHLDLEAPRDKLVEAVARPLMSTRDAQQASLLASQVAPSRLRIAVVAVVVAERRRERGLDTLGEAGWRPGHCTVGRYSRFV
jgi:hypothetical protein